MEGVMKSIVGLFAISLLSISTAFGQLHQGPPYKLELLASNLKVGQTIKLSGQMEQYLRSNCHLRLVGLKQNDVEFVVLGSLRAVSAHSSVPIENSWSTYPAMDQNGKLYQIDTYLDNIGQYESSSTINLEGACLPY
jgi:hypothetical protein